MFLKLIASKLYGVTKMRSTKKNAYWLQHGSVHLRGCMSAAGVWEHHSPSIQIFRFLKILFIISGIQNILLLFYKR